MDNPSYQETTTYKNRLKNILLFLNIAGLLFLSYVVFVTNSGERLFFSIENFAPALLMFILILLFSFLFLTKEIKNDHT